MIRLNMDDAELATIPAMLRYYRKKTNGQNQDQENRSKAPIG